MTEIINGRPQPELTKVLVLETPENKCRVINLYVDPETGKLIVEYENIPKEG